MSVPPPQRRPDRTFGVDTPQPTIVSFFVLVNKVGGVCVSKFGLPNSARLENSAFCNQSFFFIHRKNREAPAFKGLATKSKRRKNGTPFVPNVVAKPIGRCATISCSRQSLRVGCTRFSSHLKNPHIEKKHSKNPQSRGSKKGSLLGFLTREDASVGGVVLSPY